MIDKYAIIGVIVLLSLISLSVYAEYVPMKTLIPIDKIEITDNVVVTKRPNMVHGELMQ